jgi:hypothetical protein
MSASPVEPLRTSSGEMIPDFDFRIAAFPSDALSVKRFRQMFPEMFEEGELRGGFGSFFFPADIEKPEHLVSLGMLISEERVIAVYNYYQGLEEVGIVFNDDESRRCVGEAEKNLEGLYQHFKLSDSPETARLLIQQVENEGRNQAERAKGKPKE